MLTDEIPNKYSIDSVTLNAPDTSDHEFVTDVDTIGIKEKKQHICSCGKEFGHRQSLHRHRKNCNSVTKSSDNSTEFMTMLRKQQNEICDLQTIVEHQQKQITELISENQSNTTNDKFNLNSFLNDQCKDAITIQNFIENLNIGIPELEHMGHVGYIQGMISIFSNTLGKMDIYERPIHCTDLKRQTVYIKQGDTWTKGTQDKTELKKILETVKCRNNGSLRLWEREHPEAFECDTQDNIDYMRISSESLGGFGSKDAIKLNKIIKHIVKEVYVK